MGRQAFNANISHRPTSRPGTNTQQKPDNMTDKHVQHTGANLCGASTVRYEVTPAKGQANEAERQAQDQMQAHNRAIIYT